MHMLLKFSNQVQKQEKLVHIVLLLHVQSRASGFTHIPKQIKNDKC